VHPRARADAEHVVAALEARLQVEAVVRDGDEVRRDLVVGALEGVLALDDAVDDLLAVGPSSDSSFSFSSARTDS